MTIDANVKLKFRLELPCSTGHSGEASACERHQPVGPWSDLAYTAPGFCMTEYPNELYVAKRVYVRWSAGQSIDRSAGLRMTTSV